MNPLGRLLAKVFGKRDRGDAPASAVPDLGALAARPAPQDVTGWLDEAQALASLGHWEGAIPCLDKAIDRDPQCATAWHDKARCLGALGRLDEAIDCYAQALNLDPQMAAAWFSKALAEEKLGYTQDAIRSYERYLAVGSDEHPEQLEYVQCSLRDLWRDVEARAEGAARRERLSSTPAARQSPADSSAREGARRGGGRIAGVFSALRTKARARFHPRGRSRGSRLQVRPPLMVRLEPYLVVIPLLLALGLVIAFLQRCNASRMSFSQPSGQSSNPFGSLGDFSDFGEGKRAYFLGEYDTAISHFTAALDSYTPASEVYNLRALAYEAKGEHEKALQDFGQALRLDPELAMVHNNRACTYFAMGDYGKAMADLDRAIEIDATLGKAYYNRGLVNSQLGNYDAAIAELSEALLYPASESSLLFSQALGRMPGSSLADMLTAEEMERELLETGADRPSVFYQRAVAYQAKGLSDSALADLDEAIEVLSDRRAKAASYLPDQEPAFPGATAAAPEEENRPENVRVDLAAVYHLRALVHAERGEYDQAAADVDKALEFGLDPDAAQFLKALIDVWRAGAG